MWCACMKWSATYVKPVFHCWKDCRLEISIWISVLSRDSAWRSVFLRYRTGFLHVREMSEKFTFFSRSGNCQGILWCEILQKCQWKVREFYILTWWSWNVWSQCIFFAKFIKFFGSNTVREILNLSQGNVREFWSVLKYEPCRRPWRKADLTEVGLIKVC